MAKKKRGKADELLRELEGKGVRSRFECVPLAKAALLEAYCLGAKDAIALRDSRRLLGEKK